MDSKIEINTVLPVVTRWNDDSNTFISHCGIPIVNIYTQGKSIDEAEKALTRAVKLFLEYRRLNQ